MRSRLYLLSALLFLGNAAGARAQTSARAYRDWRTIRTAHFTVYFPSEMRDWSGTLAARLESVREAVDALVGNTPRARVTVVVDDPANASNGSAFPLLDAPAIYVWPTPPSPVSPIGENRTWPEILSVHEYAHIAHLTRPTRNPLQRLIWRFSPLPVGPIAQRAPRWLVEGYATYVEGRLTGSGRPFGSWRPALLRQRALEGQLPPYYALDGETGYQGGSMAYLAGSAFIEWLVAQRGEESLVALWRRMTARVDRPFDVAFAGVYGGSPAELYGRFTADLTGRALEVAHRLAPDSAHATLIQRIGDDVGSPALSRDGTLLALALHPEHDTPRIVIWHTADQGQDSALAVQRAEMLKRDPEDVPAILWHPLPKPVVAALFPAAGYAYGAPRFFGDGKRLLVTRLATLRDGTLRADLFEWDLSSGHVRRITHGAGIRSADPSPDGRSAVADRCLDGVCDLVRVDLESGVVSPLARGAPAVTYYRPRWSHDGTRLAASVHLDGHWQAVMMRADGSESQLLPSAENVDRYASAFTADDRALILVSDADGIPNLTRVDLDGAHEQPLTRVTGAAMAPEPAPDNSSVYFLGMRAGGLDLWRLAPDSPLAPERVGRDSTLVPATVAAPLHRDTFPVAPLTADRAYGFGQRALRILPILSLAPDGATGGITAAGTDPIGRYTWLAQGMIGERSAWRGLSLAASVRRWRPSIEGELFTTAQRPGAGGGSDFTSPALDASYAGGVILSELREEFDDHAFDYRGGLSAGWVNNGAHRLAPRPLAFASASAAYTQSHENWTFGERGTVHGSTGSLAGDAWMRGIASVGVEARRREGALRAEASYGRVGGTRDPFELFTVGGASAPLFDEGIWSQRVPMPALPVGIAAGRSAATARVSLVSGALEPYYWAASAGDAIGSWHRAWGIDVTSRLPPLTIIGLPASRFLAGLAYSIDRPYRHRVQGYLSLAFRP